MNFDIRDVRVKVPRGRELISVRAEYPGAEWQCEIISVSTAIDPKPTFEIGKRYRTRGGNITGPLRLSESSDFPLGGMILGNAKTWTSSGRYTTQGGGPNDLIPGAIEDECCTASEPSPVGNKVDPLCVLQGQIEALQTRVVNLMNTVECHEGAVRGQRDGLKYLRHTVTNHRERIYDQVNRISKLETAAVCDPIIIEDHSKHIGTLQEAQIKTFARLDALDRQMPSALGLTPEPLPATPIEQAIQALDKRIDIALTETSFLARHAGFQVSDGNFVRVDGEPLRPSSLPSERRDPPKRTIKGGWVNVYANQSGTSHLRMFGPYETADIAGSNSMGGRLACIRIPDITEGEGL